MPGNRKKSKFGNGNAETQSSELKHGVFVSTESGKIAKIERYMNLEVVDRFIG